MQSKEAVLAKYIPSNATGLVVSLLEANQVQLVITRSRTSKYGDFRPANRRRPNRISVNHDLNKYSFLITLIHEVAHAEVWKKYAAKAKPHGEEWKESYRRLLHPFLGNGTFPDELKVVVKKHLDNLKSSSIYDKNLTSALSVYDETASTTIFLDDLPDGAYFQIPNGRKFKKLNKVRTRCKCQDLNNKRIYLISAQATVKPFDPA